MYYIVGLGNPGKEYELTRHNSGRIAVLDFVKKEGIDGLKFDKKLNALVGKVKIGKKEAQIILPETFMNKSGFSLKPIITSKKRAENLIVVHDDVDLPLGKIKISFGKKSAGHKGVESVIKNIKTKKFIRIRIGISKETKKGVAQKPRVEKFLDYIIGKFKTEELRVIKKVSRTITSGLEIIVTEGVSKAMSLYNN
ncbi:MAG: aminoacyl-tRNA hydrolase [Patescibacteria group bacterium]